ncbi:MAG: hypothetical protein QXL19_10730 [Ignisphaera sp.]
MSQTQTPQTGKTVVYRDKHTKIVLTIKNNEIELKKIYYPDARYANNIWEKIVLDTKNRTVYYCEGRDGWGGTGVTCTDDVELSDYGFNVIYEDMLNVKSPSAFNDLASRIQAKAYNYDEEEYYKRVWLRAYYESMHEDDPEELEL